MLNLKKTQVGALLKVISKDEMRPILTNVLIDNWGDDTVLVATNGYIMAVLQVDKEDGEKLNGRLIRRDAIERWYKLAIGKSRLNTQELIRVSNDDYAHHSNYETGQYPDWKKLLPEGEPEGTDRIAFDANLAKSLQDLEESDGLQWTVYGQLKPLVTTTDKGTYLLMPRKSK